MASISLTNIWKIYPGDVVAVNDFNLEIEDKEFIILVGPSGCGKSTTLRMIAGLEEISKGTLKIGDKVVNDVAPKDRDIAMVFQNYALYPHMTVYKNMAFGLELKKTPKDVIDKKVTDAAKLLDIEHLLQRKPKALSGGQRQRVALGRAMVRDPAVFLLDEPLSNLDAKLRTAMRSEITKLHQRLQTTFVYVTHDQIEAMTMADRIVVMKDGFIQQVDTPQNLYDFPCNMFVASFIGSPQMNCLSVSIVERDGVFFAKFGDNLLKIPKEKVEASVIRPYVGKKVMMGIRPEDLHDDNTFVQMGDSNTISCYVDIAEMMGAEYYLYLVPTKVEGDPKLIATVPSRSLARAGKTVDIAFDMRKIHLFDVDTELTICN